MNTHPSKTPYELGAKLQAMNKGFKMDPYTDCDLLLQCKLYRPKIL